MHLYMSAPSSLLYILLTIPAIIIGGLTVPDQRNVTTLASGCAFILAMSGSAIVLTAFSSYPASATVLALMAYAVSLVFLIVNIKHNGCQRICR